MDYLKKWIDSGFLSIQTLMDTLIARNLTGDRQLRIEPSVQSVFVPKHYEDDFADYVEGSMGLF